MTSAAPTILALETDSAWVIILASSAVVLAATIGAARLISRSGGLASGLLLALPLALPLAAAVAFAEAALPEAAVLRPAGDVLLDKTGGLLDLLVVENQQDHTLTPYAVSRSAGSWLLIIGVLASSFMLVRRLIGALVVRSLLRRCRALGDQEAELGDLLRRLCDDLRLRRIPELLVLPPSVGGAFVMGLRRPKVLLSADLLRSLDDSEIEGVLAHELAHLRARDVELVLVAGLLRDLVAWNPFAHLAYRHLRRDRELEADRCAAAATEKPLAVASGLLKVAETMLATSRSQRSGALAFFGTRRLVTARVSQLLAVADGRAQVLPARHLPFLAAACVAAVIGFQVAAQIAEREPPALALVWDATEGREGLWAPKRYRNNHQRSVGGHSVAPGRRLGKVDPRRRLSYPQLAGDVSVKPRHLDEWVAAMDEWTHELGESPITTRWEGRRNWEAVPLVAPVGDGSLGIYEVKLGLAEATR